MATQRITLTSAPVRISDGLRKVFAQSVSGRDFHFIQGNVAPTSTEIFHYADELTIPEGFSIWAWNPSPVPMNLVTSTAE